MLKVLIVEDSATIREFLRHVLGSDPDIEVVGTASNGEEALPAVLAHEPDAITMDINMPQVDGLEATRRIRERERATGGRIPIIAMTAHAMKGDLERCLESGMDGYVSKPVQKKELSAQIETYARTALGAGA